MRGLKLWLRRLLWQDPRSETSSPGESEVVLQISGAEGSRLLEIERYPNGLYRFVEQSEMPADEYTSEYFAPTHLSGLYGSAEDAERDARLMLPWLRGQAAD